LLNHKPASTGTFLDRLYAKINGGLDRFSTLDPAAAARRPRKTWTIEVVGRRHTLELKPKRQRWESGPRVFLDGLRMGNLRQPGGRHGRTEATLDRLALPDVRVIVALEWRRDWDENLRVDVFLNGISLLDGRTLDEARATAPGAIGRYDTQMSKLQRSLGKNLYIVVIGPSLSAGCAAGVVLGLCQSLSGSWGGLAASCWSSGGALRDQVGVRVAGYSFSATPSRIRSSATWLCGRPCARDSYCGLACYLGLKSSRPDHFQPSWVGGSVAFAGVGDA
jgi:hypothetical protein